MVVHLQHAGAAGRAVVCAVWLARLAFLAEPEFAVRFDCKVRGGRRYVRRERAVSIAARCGAGAGEDGCGVGPVEEDEEGDAQEG